MTEQQFQNDVLQTTAEMALKVEGYKTDIVRLKEAANTAHIEIEKLRRQGGGGFARPPGFVSDGCAEFIGALAIAGAERKGRLQNLEPSVHAAIIRKTEGILGRAALTGADIPLPVAYGHEIAELVAEFGAARRWGRVFPLPTGVTKMPRLKTAPTFGLIAMSETVWEKSPQMEYVTFTAQKYGGMIRLPTEIGEDSFVAIGQWLTLYCARELAAAEDRLYFIADGTETYGSVTGLVGKLIALGQKLQVAAQGGLDVTLQNLRDLRTKVSSAAFRNSGYFLHRSHESLLFSFNNTGDTPYVVAGNEPRLDGYPCRWTEVLPVCSALGVKEQGQILFGDLSYHWLGIAGQIRIETSPHAAFTTDEILIRALERFDCGLMADDALAVLQLANW